MDRHQQTMSSTQKEAKPRSKIINPDRESLMGIIQTLHRVFGESEKEKMESP